MWKSKSRKTIKNRINNNSIYAMHARNMTRQFANYFWLFISILSEREWERKFAYFIPHDVRFPFKINFLYANISHTLMMSRLKAAKSGDWYEKSRETISCGRNFNNEREKKFSSPFWSWVWTDYEMLWDVVWVWC